MLVAVPKEIRDGELRVALVPDIINKLTRLGLDVAIESGAGLGAQANDDAYRTIYGCTHFTSPMCRISRRTCWR